MAKASTRFRNRKINFKTRIAVRIGNNAVEFEDDVLGEGGEEVEFEEDKKGGHGVDTGVDKEEEGEVHLQAVLASSSASVSRSIGNNTGTNGTRSSTTLSGPPSSSPVKAAPKAFIPTPDSTGTIDLDLYRRLYPPGAYADPVTNIRFSDTVEDAQTGAAAYTMDEDDEDWLEAHNLVAVEEAKVLGPASPSTSTSITALASTPNGRSGRERKGKGEKGKEKADDKGKEVAAGPISEDDFEEVMELFEIIAEQKAPMAHVDTSSLPTLPQMEAALLEAAITKPSLISLKNFARSIYPHWRERRMKRGGKGIIPQLDYDESNESNPYVCFRRRELKTSRKTRRSDAQNIERLIRLRNDLYAAHALMLKTRDRERLKLEVLDSERKIFEGRCVVRDLKRRLGEIEGDEELLIGRREKKRKREEPQPGSIRIQLRKPDTANPASFAFATAEELKAKKERAAAIVVLMERDMQKKREADASWEDWTDGAYIARLPPTSARHWRTLEPYSDSVNGDTLAFASSYQHAVGTVRTSFRRRVGRGGRVMLDRIAPGRSRSSTPTYLKLVEIEENEDESGSEEEEVIDLSALARREERLRFDRDVSLDFPSVDEPVVIDDFAFHYLVKRTKLRQPTERSDDPNSLLLDSSYLEEAYRWAAIEPERHAPPLVYGLPPPRASVPVQPSGPGGVTIQGLASNASAAAGYNQMMVAANHAQRLAAQQAQVKRLSTGGGGVAGGEQMRIASSGSPLTQGGQQVLPTPLPMSMPMPMPMTMPTNGTVLPHAGTWTNNNGMVASSKDGIPPTGFPNHLHQQQPQQHSMTNGLHQQQQLQLQVQQQQQLQQQQQQQQMQQLQQQQQRLPTGLLASLPPSGGGGGGGGGGVPLSMQQQQQQIHQHQVLLHQQQQLQQQQHLQQQAQQLHLQQQHQLSQHTQQLHQQQLQQQQQHATSSPLPPSRPTSAASPHSPSFINQPLLSPVIRTNAVSQVRPSFPLLQPGSLQVPQGLQNYLHS